MPAKDFAQIVMEESPLNELTFDDALTPSRVSSDRLYPAARSVRIVSSPQHLSRADELRGIQGEVPRLIDGYEPAGSLTERAYPDDLTWYLALAGFDATHTAGNGVITDPDGDVIPAGAERWVFTKRDATNAKTARIKTNYATENVLLEGYGFGISQLTLNAQGELGTDWMGLFMRRLAADAVTVPAVRASAIPPFRRGDLFISALAGGARPSDWTFQIANPLERIRSMALDPPSYWPDAMEYGDDQVAVSGSLPKRSLDSDDYDALLDASTFEMIARFISPENIGLTAYPYGLWIEMPAVQYVGGEQDELGNKRRFGFSPDWFAMYDETLGYDCKITLVNSIAALETWGGS